MSGQLATPKKTPRCGRVNPKLIPAGIRDLLLDSQSSLLRQRRIEVSRSPTVQRRSIQTRISGAKEFRHRPIRTARRNDIELMASELEAAPGGVQVAMLDVFACASQDDAVPSRGLRGVRHRDDQVRQSTDAIAMRTLARHPFIARGF